MLPIQPFDANALKAIILFVPVIGLIIAFAIRPPSYFRLVGMMLGTLLNIPYLLLLNIIAIYFGWWSYTESMNSFYQVPIELLIGWAVFWGAFLPYVFERFNVFIPLLLALLIDVIAMPKLEPLFTLGENWLVGELVFLVLCLLPALLIYRLTVNRAYVSYRGFFQSIIWGGWNVFLIPAIVLHFEGKDIFSVLSMEGWFLTIFLNAMVFAIFVGYAALHEFIKVGEGTPIPFDPPQYLVTTGPYAYVANPLQISTLFMFLSIAALFESALMILPIIALIVYSEFFVRWHHEIDIEKRLGKEWFTYKRNVRNWLPRWKPYIHKTSTMFFAKDCEICQETESWMKQLNPAGLYFMPAHQHPSKDLDRVTYQHYSKRFEEDGINAIARVFEHINFSFAMLGWFMRLPVINRIIQIFADGAGVRGEKVTREQQ